jgi:hypothetical protein
MLARFGRLPASGDYSYEVKWDGVGCKNVDRHPSSDLPHRISRFRQVAAVRASGRFERR